MLMTEKEAKTCSCTISEMYIVQSLEFIENKNKNLKNIHQSFIYGTNGQRIAFKKKCFASKCAMWKWLEDSCSLLCYDVPLKSVGHCPFAERTIDLVLYKYAPKI